MDISRPVLMRPKTFLESGISSLLTRKPIVRRLEIMAEHALRLRESAFIVNGRLGAEGGTLIVSGLREGEALSVFTGSGFIPLGRSKARGPEFSLMSIHAHPYLGEPLESFSSQDIFANIRTIREGIPFSHAFPEIGGLLQVFRWGRRAFAHLLFVQATGKVRPSAVKKYDDLMIRPGQTSLNDSVKVLVKLGFNVGETAFELVKWGTDRGSLDVPRTGGPKDDLALYLATHEGTSSLSNLTVWPDKSLEDNIVSSFEERENSSLSGMFRQSHADEKERAKKLLRRIKCGGEYRGESANASFLILLERRMEKKGMYELGKIMRSLEFSGLTAQKLSRSVLKACKRGRAAPDFSIKMDGNELTFWKINNQAFERFKGVKGMLLKGEAAYINSGFEDFKADAVVIGQNEERLEFLSPKTIQKVYERTHYSTANAFSLLSALSDLLPTHAA